MEASWMLPGGWSIAASDPAESVAAEGAQPSWRFESTCGSLPCPSQAVSCLAAEMTELWAEEGSSVTMHAPAIRNISLVEWEYIRENIPKLILRYYAESQSVTIYPAYKGRVVFYQNNGSLVLQKLRETDSGIYKATVNSMQDKATTTTLRVIGLTPSTCAAQKMTAAALVLTAISAVLFVIHLSQLGKLRLGKEAWEWLMMSILGLLCTSSLLLLPVSVIWMQEDGHSAAFILLGLFLSPGIVAMALTAVVMAPCRPAVLTHFRSRGWHRVILCITATMLVVNLLFTSLLLRGFHQLHERGCSEAVNLTIGFVIPAVAVLSMLLLLFLWYYKKNQEKQQQPDPQEVSHSLQTTSTLVTSSTHQLSPSPVAADTHYYNNEYLIVTGKHPSAFLQNSKGTFITTWGVTSEEPVIGKAGTFLLGQSRHGTNAKVDTG
ncbi:uncharacterized protein [Anas acuta]|uniref:uncharacterized protein isoform X7 n=1 Tax=Anas acuta TaxID=28680 RepID=UPI0035C8E1DD